MATSAEANQDQQRTSKGSGAGSRFVLLACGATHLVTDGQINALFPLFPLMAADLQLNYTEVGLVRTSIRVTSSLLQIPVGYLADWIPDTVLLGAGMAWLSAGLIAMAAAAGFWSLLLLTAGAGVGGSAQHPLATAIVSKAFESGRRGAAVSSLNFAGDLGKALFPALAGAAAILYGWRGALVALGLAGLVVSIGYALAMRRAAAGAVRPARTSGEKPRGWGIQQPFRFALLSAIGIIEDSTRVAVATFLPFLIMEKGLDAARAGFMLTLVFGFGAAGKLGCGLLADRFGSVGVILITQGITAVSILAMLPVDPVLLVPVIAAFGFVGAGTSSVLYMTVAEMVPVESRARGYALFYTLCLGGATLAPVAYGALADVAGLASAFVAMAAVTALALPMALGMRGRA